MGIRIEEGDQKFEKGEAMGGWKVIWLLIQVSADQMILKQVRVPR
jgi:hypothetical protein